MCVLMSTLSLIVNQGEWSHLGILILRNYFVALFFANLYRVTVCAAN